MKESIVERKSYYFSIRMVKLFKYLAYEKKEFVLSKQCLRSGTSICASVRESSYAQSRSDFIHKLSIAVKEANETEYWLSLLHDTGYIDSNGFRSVVKDCKEIIKILCSSILTAKSKLNKDKSKPYNH